MERILADAYYGVENPASYTGLNQLAKYTRSNIGKTRDWLKTQDAYTLHRQKRYNFKRRRTYCTGINSLIQMDLVDMQSVARYNDGFRYILVAIDVFSKRAYAQKLKSKSGHFVAPAVSIILDQMFPRPIYCQTDRGTEYLCSQVQELFRSRNIKHYWSYNDEIKASVIERFIRTLKSKMYKYFTHNNTHRWVDVLQSLVDSYNSSYHNTIKMTPNQVTGENEDIVRGRLYPESKSKPNFKYQVGQKCRISKAKHVFQKGFREGWSEEIFVIRQRFATTPVTYGLEDLMKEEITGRFYEEEIQPVTKDDEEEYKIDRVMKTRRNSKGEIENLVRWRGYSSKFDSWVSDLRNV